MIDPAGHECFGALVDGHRLFVLVTHMNPDGDALGSQIALARYLLAAGRSVRIVNHDPTPEGLRFLEDPDLRAEVYGPASHDAVLDESEAIVLLDNSAPDRLGRLEGPLRARGQRVLCIDHHPTRDTPWAWNILDVGSCATAAMVYELTRARGYSWDRRGAEALYVGLATDTGFFRFNSTTVRAHEIAADLLRLGVDPAKCFREVYERNSPSYTRLLGRALAGLRVDAGGAVAAIRITEAMTRECGAESVDTSEMTTPVLAMDGVRVAVLFRELSGGRIKVSLRSKGELDVHRLAAEFGGGGHRNASGIVMKGGIDDVSEQVIARASSLV